jgi:hypothetical protein
VTDDKFSTKDILIATAIARGVKRKTVADEHEVSERTLRNRMADPQFRRLVSDLRSEMIDGVVGALASLGAKAVYTLAKLMDAQSDGVRLQAATTILTTMMKGRENIEFSERLNRLEEQYMEREHN